MNDKLKKLIPVLSILPFIIGTVGYVLAGEAITDALYASFALYFINPVSDNYNVLVDIARWTSALVTTTAILYVIRELWAGMICRIKCMAPDSVAVYSDKPIGISFGKKVRAIYAGQKFLPHAKSHIIMLDSDCDSLRFYNEHENILKEKKVYIGLNELEFGLINTDSNAVFYDINGTIARVLWKSVALWEREKTDFTIAVYGNGTLSENILNYGLLLNLFSDKQHISYKMIGSQSYFVKHPDMRTENADTLSYHSMDDDGIWEVLGKSDLIIISEKIPAALLQTFAVVCSGSEIYYYSPEKGDEGDYLTAENIHSFGRNSDILTDANIRQGALIENARQINLRYAKAYNGNADWNKLSGFLKLSNISSADYREVLEYLIRSGRNTDIDKLSELEHIRWCRFHYINYWKYGVPENGKNKDEKRKIHSCLKGYYELPEEERRKDSAMIAELLEAARNEKTAV